MKTPLKKFVAVGLCAGLLFASGIYATPAFADNDDILTKRELKPVKRKFIPEGNAYIPKGTKLTLEFAKRVSSKTARKGAPIPIVTAEDVFVNGVLVIPAGTRIKGFFTVARKAGNMGRSGKLELTIESVTALNGVDIPLNQKKHATGKDDVAGAVAVVSFVSVVGGFFMKGRNVEISKGTQFTIEVPEDADLEVSLDNLRKEMSLKRPRGVNITIK